MNPISLFCILAGVALNACAQLLLKAGTNAVGHFEFTRANILPIGFKLATQLPIIGGLGCYVISVAVWVDRAVARGCVDRLSDAVARLRRQCGRRLVSVRRGAVDPAAGRHRHHPDWRRRTGAQLGAAWVCAGCRKQFVNLECRHGKPGVAVSRAEVRGGKHPAREAVYSLAALRAAEVSLQVAVLVGCRPYFFRAKHS